MTPLKWFVPIVGLAAACHTDPLESSDQIAGWANAASALGVFTHGYEPLAYADGEIAFADASCPATSDDGMTVTIAGDGCEDSEGDIWYGTATVVRSGGDRQVEMDGYGRARDGGPVGRVTGSFDVVELDVDRHEFDVSLAIEGGVDSEIEYLGTVEGGYDGPTLWNGAGTVYRAGGAIHNGEVDAVTVDQLRDNDICSGEGISGTTTLVSDEHTVVISYDGATDCDDDDSARWSQDGEDQGLVSGVVCAIGHPGAAHGVPALAILAVLGLFAAWIRRYRR